jgi:hypothetical protein
MAEVEPQPIGYQKRKHHHPKRAHQPRKQRRVSTQNFRSGPTGVAPEPLLCCICSDAEKPPSYKCPKCRASYCSVLCCKEHKKICAGKSTDEQTISSTSKSPFLLNLAPLEPPHRKRRHGVIGDDDEDSLEDGWKLTDEMKRAVEQSEWLHKQLQDGGLRDLMLQIVESKDVEALRQVQQRFPHFQVFLDKLLVVAGVLERENDAADGEDELEPLQEWLARDWSQDSAPTQLSLKPLRRKMPVFQPVDVSSSSNEEDDASSVEVSSDSSGSCEVDGDN